MRYDPQGRRRHVLSVPGRHASCPAFGGADLGDMLVTTAREGIENPDAARGLPYLPRPGFPGLPGPEVVL